MADLISWGSLFQTEAAARSPVVERRVPVAGMASEDDAAERRCLVRRRLVSRRLIGNQAQSR